ncbi:MAG: hypothetical protein WA064_03710 [Candidatus Moraniibacteriota bacterium]
MLYPTNLKRVFLLGDVLLTGNNQRIIAQNLLPQIEEILVVDLAKFKEVSKMSRDEFMEYIAQPDSGLEPKWDGMFDFVINELDDRSRRILKIMFPNAQSDDDFEEAFERGLFKD